MESCLGYIVFRDGKVWIADLPKPEAYGFDDDAWSFYGEQLNMYLDSQIEATNTRHFPDAKLSKITGHEYYVKIDELISQLTEGQKVQHIDGKIIKIE